MRSLYRQRKKSKRLDRVEKMSREEFEAKDLDSLVEMIRNLLLLGLIQIFEELDKEVTALCGGLEISEGILVVIDGSKGLRAAVRNVFKFNKRALVQRCMWHKRENTLGYFPKQQHVWWRRRLQRAYDRPTYKEASTELRQIHRELEKVNQSAARALAEGMEETLYASPPGCLLRSESIGQDYELH